MVGVADVKLTMEYHFDPEICVDEIEQLDLKPYIGRDVADVYLVAIGDSPRLLGTSKQRQFTYRPWRTAQYWVLACDRDACFVTMTMHHRI